MNHNISNLRRLYWFDSYSKFARLSLDYNLTNYNNELCYSVGDPHYDQFELFFTIIDSHSILDDQLLLNTFQQENLEHSLNTTETNLIGCAASQLKSNEIVLKCIFNKLRNDIESRFLYGKPCSKCDVYDGKCDEKYQGLCTSNGEYSRQTWMDTQSPIAEKQDITTKKAENVISFFTQSIVAINKLYSNIDAFMLVLFVFILVSVLVAGVLCAIFLYFRKSLQRRLKVIV